MSDSDWFRVEQYMRGTLKMAYQAAQASPDPSTQCGAMIFDTAGNCMAVACNDFTPGVEVTPDKLERPMKYLYVEHAERGAIHRIGRTGRQPFVMFAPWAACADCARAIVLSGIRVLVRHKQAQERSPERWIESIRLADDIMISGGVEIIEYDGPINSPRATQVQIMHCEELWTP